ncbi:MAG: methionyl-tRNA formyltransferase [Kiritimatiellae bacterium]|jgi:methionyl-tRNA formyltransferase|nr:methionyl-tRNA formyltransferase [Kiritimatiellia bacterium]
MRIVFMGSPDAAAVTLRAILRTPPLQVVGVVTQPDRPAGRNRVLTPCPCKAYAVQKGLAPIITPEKVNDPAVLSQIEALKPDVIVVVAFGQLLCKRLLDMAPHGCINGHFSLLPKYRGAAPVQSAITSGDEVSGVTIMQLDEGMDDGDMLLKAIEPICSDDTGESYMERLAILGAVTMVKALRLMIKGKLPATPQNHEEATFSPKIKKNDGLINWYDSAAVIERKSRAFYPWPGMYTFLPEHVIKHHSIGRLKVISAEVEPKCDHCPLSLRPGAICTVKTSGAVVKTGDGCLNLLIVQPDGSRRMDGGAFLNGHQLKSGDCLRSEI